MKKSILFFVFVICASCAIGQTSKAVGEVKPVIECGAKTTKGTACKMRVSKVGDKCYHHSPLTPTCGSPTTTGGKCSRKVKVSGDHCYQHVKKS